MRSWCPQHRIRGAALPNRNVPSWLISVTSMTSIRSADRYVPPPYYPRCRISPLRNPVPSPPSPRNGCAKSCRNGSAAAASSDPCSYTARSKQSTRNRKPQRGRGSRGDEGEEAKHLLGSASRSSLISARSGPGRYEPRPSPPARRASGWQRDPARRIMPYGPSFSSNVHSFLR